MNKIILIVICLFIACAIAEGKDEEVNLQQEFGNAKKLIESNCGDCMGGTKEALEKGIAELIKVIESGYRNELEAYKLLAYAYNEMAAVYLARNPNEKKIVVEKYRKTYQKLIQLAPNDPEILYGYAISLPLEDKTVRLKIFQEILRIDPNHKDANYMAGLILIEKGEYDEGIKDLKKALDQLEFDQDLGLAMRAIEILNKHGKKEEANEIQIKINQQRKYTQGLNEIRYGDVDKGIKLVKESVQGDLRRLREYQIKLVTDELERKQRYKEAAEVYELVDSIKYKVRIENLKEKAKTEKKK
jgi:tetratricopeptide (TPR) repeat protein